MEQAPVSNSVFYGTKIDDCCKPITFTSHRVLKIRMTRTKCHARCITHKRATSAIIVTVAILYTFLCASFTGAYTPQFPTRSDKSSNIKSSVQETLLEWFKNSDLVAKLHAEHIVSPQVSHMMKSTKLVDASDADKLRFAESFMGKLVSDSMAKEQELLGKWKVNKIVEVASKSNSLDDDGISTASGGFDIEASHEELLELIRGTPITLFSFVDCPWCLLAKKLLEVEPYAVQNMVQIIELEELGWNGKEIRASIALATGRTSMPACFVGGKSIGGFTDGFQDYDDELDNEVFVPDASFDLRLKSASGMKKMHETGKLQALLEEAKLALLHET